MNKYKVIIVGLLGLFFTSCEDFLDRPSEDNLPVEDYCKTEKELNALTAVLYGGMVWNEYQDKFAWCAHELMSGNVYHEYGAEGQFFFFNIEKTNTIMSLGYTSLNAVVARANTLINEMPGLARANGIPEDVIRRGVAEAKMYRGMAYFLQTELWGEVPVVLNNAKVISENTSMNVPRAKREFIFKLIEEDWKYAENNLPDASWGEGWRVTKWSAKGMLAKLYLTMASCQDEEVALCRYDPAEYYTKARDYAKDVLENSPYSIEDNYTNVFIQNNRASNESLFALQFYDGRYGVGSSRQIQFGRSSVWNGDLDVYGGGKGLTVTLFESFDMQKDTRLKETSLYSDGTKSDLTVTLPNGKPAVLNNPVYTLANGDLYSYFINPNGQFPTGAPFGSETVGYTLNGIKKYVYGYKPLGDKFSCPMRTDFLRVADVKLIVTEAEMWLQGATAVDAYSSASEALGPLNDVRKRAGLDPVNSIALCVPEIEKTVTIPYTNKGGISVSIDFPTFESTYDLLLERRWEFALECQSWFDLKRVAYRDKVKATQFIEQQDRSWAYKPKLDLEGTPTVKGDYQRQRIMFRLGEALGYTPEEMPTVDEKKVYYEDLKWFLPLPQDVLSSSPALSQPAQGFEGILDNQDEFGRFSNYPF